MTSLAQVFLVLALVLGSGAAHAEEFKTAEVKAAIKKMSLIPVQSGGRIKPLDTAAREMTLFLTTSRSYEGQNPLEWILDLSANPEAWMESPFVAVSDADTRKQIGLPLDARRFSPKRLMEESYLRQYAARLRAPGKKQIVANLSGGVNREDPREKELKRVLERLDLFQGLLSGYAWPLIARPDPQSPISVAEQPEHLVAKAFLTVLESYRAKDSARFVKGVDQLDYATRELFASKQGYSQFDLKLELFYNSFHPFLWGSIGLFLAALAWIFTALNFASKSRKSKTTLPKLSAVLLTTLGMGCLIAGMALRSWIAGRPPVSNMYESIIWVSFGVSVFGVILYWLQKSPLILAVSTLLSAFGLFVSDAAPAVMDPSIHPLVPVLRSNLWLTIHVLTITLGYAAFALSLGLGNVSLWHFLKGKSAKSPEILSVNQMAYRAIQWGVVLLAAGTILGGVWADYSWGRFWGWDPKEVWALIALLGYLAILHARFTGWMSSFGFAAWSVVSFMLVVMAWYGVNFVLGVGLHSYGFSTGGRGTVFAGCALQLGFVALVAAKVGAFRRLK